MFAEDTRLWALGTDRDLLGCSYEPSKSLRKVPPSLIEIRDLGLHVSTRCEAPCPEPHRIIGIGAVVQTIGSPPPLHP